MGYLSSAVDFALPGPPAGPSVVPGLSMVCREAVRVPYGSARPAVARVVRGDGVVTASDDGPVGSDSGDALDTDAIEELGEEIVTLAAHIHAAKQELLALIARFDRVRGWEVGGFQTCAHWLSFSTGYDLGTAREHVRVARALEHLPEIRRSMGEGKLSFSQARALTRVARPDTEIDLLELAEGCPVGRLERFVRAARRSTREDEAERERRQYLSRAFSVFPDDNGMSRIDGRVNPEVGAALGRAIEAAADFLYREGFRGDAGAGGLEDRFAEDPSLTWLHGTDRDACRLRADALELIAISVLSTGFVSPPGQSSTRASDTATAPDGPTSGASKPVRPVRATCRYAATEDGPEASRRTVREQDADAGCGARVPVSGTRAERYQVVLYVDSDTLSADGEPGTSELEDGSRISCETSRRLACDASVVRVSKSVEGEPLDVGRKTRTIPGALRRALNSRDRGCRFPGCGLRFTDAHHVVHWADGGETSLRNTLLLCRHHHRLVHEGGWTVSIEWPGAGCAAFRDPRGTVHVGRTRRVRLSDRPVEALRARNRRRGVEPDGDTAGARWNREADIPDSVWFRALEALP